jgi:hypothetical protein
LEMNYELNENELKVKWKWNIGQVKMN